MIIDNTAAFRYLLNDDIYLIKKDMDNLERAISSVISNEAKAIPDVLMPPIVLEDVPKPVEKPILHFDYHGKNQQQFLIVCSYSDSETMDEKHLEALKSALLRKGLASDDVAILNIARYTEATSNHLNEYFKPARLLLLGQSTLLSGWQQFALNQLESHDGIKVLYTYDFTQMLGDRDKTKAFWEQMKVL